MIVVAYILAFLIGLTLAMIGSGGSILTVPVLVYILNVDPIAATAYSLFIVGMTAMVGAGVGILTGLVGAGGGFLIIPALVLLAGLPMKMAVGTSLALIAMKSVIGFGGDLQAGLSPDWTLLFGFTIVAIIGILLGARLTTRIPSNTLKRGFGIFLILVAVAMLVTEIGNR
jgi:uncharacterized membrane protein YfcA